MSSPSEWRRPRLWILGLLALVVGCLSALSWEVRENRAEEMQEWNARLGAMATDRRVGVDRWLVERLGDTRLLAADTSLIRAAGEAPADAPRTARSLERALDVYGWAAGWVLDAAGRVAVRGGGPPTPTPQEVALAREALERAAPAFRFFTDPVRMVGFAAPLPDGSGVALLRADPGRYLFPLLDFEPVPTRTGETLLARVETDSVVFLNRPRTGTARAERIPEVSDGAGRTMLAALEGEEGFGEFVDHRGTRVLAATRRLENAPWGLVVKVDRSEALADHRRLRTILLVATAGLLVGVLALATAYWAWRTARSKEAAAAALRKSEERHRLLFQTSRDAIFVSTPGGSILDANPACRELFGLEGDLAAYRAADFYVDPEDRERFRTRMLQDGGVEDLEVELRDLCGRAFTALFSATLLRDEEGDVSGFHGTVRDISARKAAEERLRESEERFRLTHEHAPVGIAIVALDGTFTRVNPALAEMVGYAPEELVGRSFQEITHTDDLAVDLAHVRELLDGEVDSYEMEKRYVHRDGRPVWVHLTASLVRGRDGEPLHFVAHLRDVTERVQARAELEASERRFRSLIENGSDLISLLDAEGITRYQSPAFRRILGYEDGALEDIDTFDLVHPDDRARIRDAFEALLEHPARRARQEYRFRHADGSWRVLETRAVNLLDDPTVSAVVVNSRDVTERRAAEREIERTSARLRTILDTITEAVVLVDAEGSLSFANPASEEILGITPREADGRRYDDPGWEITAVDGGPFPPEELPFRRVMRTGRAVRNVRHAIRHPDGERAILSVNAAPIRGRDGTLAGMVASIQDVTEQTRTEEEIQRLNQELELRVRQRTAELSAANQELEAFAYSVSHDLRAPLRALDGFSQALADDYRHRLDGEALDFLERIQANSRRMAQLIDDILELSRVSRRELAREAVDLAAVAREVVDDLREAEPHRTVTFSAPETLRARGDAQLLRIVLENLLGNAWKFTRHRDEARIELGVEGGNGCRRYFVRDDGAGFDMAYVDKLFKPFHRLHLESEFEGTGIGLATVERIIRRHGGTVEAEGAEGEGATLRFTLGADTRG